MKSEHGFVALMTVIIITAILLVLMCTMEIWSFFSRFDTLDTERMWASELLAESCISRAVQHLAIDSSYSPHAGGECVAITGVCGSSPNVCKICSIDTAGSVRTIYARAVEGGAYTNLQVTVDTSADMKIKGWNELSTYAGPTCLVP